MMMRFLKQIGPVVLATDNSDNFCMASEGCIFNHVMIPIRFGGIVPLGKSIYQMTYQLQQDGTITYPLEQLAQAVDQVVRRCWLDASEDDVNTILAFVFEYYHHPLDCVTRWSEEEASETEGARFKDALRELEYQGKTEEEKTEILLERFRRLSCSELEGMLKQMEDE